MTDEAVVRFKRGDTRADGRVFWDYRPKRGKEIAVWCSPESFAKRKQNETNRAKRKREEGYRDDPIKRHARDVLRYAVSSGRVKKPSTCQDCNSSTLLEGHHPRGYEDPLDVEWLCKRCHGKRHKKIEIVRPVG